MALERMTSSAVTLMDEDNEEAEAKWSLTRYPGANVPTSNVDTVRLWTLSEHGYCSSMGNITWHWLSACMPPCIEPADFTSKLQVGRQKQKKIKAGSSVTPLSSPAGPHEHLDHVLMDRKPRCSLPSCLIVSASATYALPTSTCCYNFPRG